MRKALRHILLLLTLLPGCKQHHLPESSLPTHNFKAGEYYDYYGVRDSAFYYYNRVTSQSPDSLERGTAYFKMGLQQLEAGDYFSAQESLLSSIKALDELNPVHHSLLSSDYNSLANATLALKDYEGALNNYQKSSQFAPPGDPQLYILNNLGVAYQKKGDYPKALVAFDSALQLKTSDTSLLSKLISNKARTQWLADPRFNPLPYFRRALALRKAVRDSGGLNASYAHLSDYYTSTQPDSAQYYARQRLELAQQLGEPSNRMEALSQMAKVSPPGETKRYFERYLQLDDSLSTVRSRDRNQYVLIKFEAQKSKADNLLLQKHINRQRLTLWGVVLLAVLVIGGFIWIAQARRRRLQRAAEKALQAQRLRTSQKVHDVVANGLYKIMNELEHKEGVDRESLLNQIEALYEKSRDISYEGTPREPVSFGDQLLALVDSFSDEQTQIILIGNEKAFWSRVSEAQQRELELVIKELLVNMKKHSRACLVHLYFEGQESTGTIRYKDDGVGFSGPQPSFGNGLSGTVNRIEALNGTLSFGPNGTAGVSILISFPLATNER